MTNSNTKNVIVTGGAGYIGSHACKALSRSGFTPITFDNLSRGHEWAVKWGPLEKGDILDEDRLDEVFSKYTPCAVMHFAALAYVGESVTNPLKYYRNNVTGTHNLLNRMITNGIDKFIFSSTCAIYGNPEVIPINEEHVKNPINPYGNTKATVEAMLADLSQTNLLSYISLRYFNAAGADPDSEIGECHEPETHLIPLVLEAAASIRSHVEVYGNDYDTPDGTCIRDYIHATDLADAHIRALEYLLDGGSSNFYNLGTENGYSVNEIIENAKQVSGKVINVRVISRRPGDPPVLIADSSKIKQKLGWTLKYSDINLIMSSAWQWQTKNQLEKK